ncbi:hypothetical protein M9Y10_017746 [Tritrichomonas musculus]|uniref:Uncharacterized protein n=1 Tax=Tritrichomonas musculus TaxID=1915356 RepID=A0ABR2HUD6_9EUKA
MEEEDDIFLLKSDSEPEKDEKNNESIDQNKIVETITPLTNKDQNKKKHKKNHHHHHHHHHHSKSKSKSTSKENKSILKTSNFPIIQNETFCLNNPTKDDEEDIVNFKFELSDSYELSNENNQFLQPNASIPRIIEAPKPDNIVQTPKQIQKIETPKPDNIIQTPKQIQKIETPKTEIKASSLQITNILPIEKKELNNDFQITSVDQKSDELPDIKIVPKKKDLYINKTPKKIQLTTNRNTTQSSFEYKILSALDQSLNHLSQDFLEDFQYYVEKAFSYDQLFDDFMISLKSEVLEIFQKNNNLKENNIRLIDNLPNITENITNNVPHLKKTGIELPLKENESVDVPDVLHIQEKLISTHQCLAEIQSEKSNFQENDEFEIHYENLKSSQLKRVELEAISQVQSERMRHLEARIKEIQDKNDLNMKHKYCSTYLDESLKNSMTALMKDLQNINIEDRNKRMPKLDKIKKDLYQCKIDNQQISYEIEYYENLVEKSFCPLFKQFDKQYSFGPFASHRRENIISE